MPWPPREDKLLYRTVLPRNYRTVPVPRPVTSTVVLEASPLLEDNQWVLDLAAREPFIVGFVGNLPVGTKSFGENLKRFAQNPVFRGIRMHYRNAQATPENTLLFGDLKNLADHDLSLDLMGGIEVLPFAARVAKEVPALRIIIDHLAGAAIDGKKPRENWVVQMQLIANKPGIFCKVSGLVEGTGRTDGSAPKDVEFYRPVLDTMRKLFGPERLIYASNWPVSERYASLDTIQRIIEGYFQSQGPRAREQVFAKTAMSAYRCAQRTK